MVAGTQDIIASVPGRQSITGAQCMIVMLNVFLLCFTVSDFMIYGRQMHEPKQ